MSDKQRVLRLLSDGKPHTHHEIYDLHVVGHSRISDLRADGYVIDRWNEGMTSVYQLLSGPVESRSEETVGADGLVASHQSVADPWADSSPGPLNRTAPAVDLSDGGVTGQPVQLHLLSGPGAYEDAA